MPLYDYICPSRSCKHQWEQQVTIAESNNVKCPKCGTIGEKQMPSIKPHVSWGKWKVSLNQGK